MILHTINKSVFTDNCLNDCLTLCTKQASIVLIEDGVYAATSNPNTNTLIKNHSHIQFYALKADLLARGLMNSLNPDIIVVDDTDFVNLCVTHDTVQSWY